MIVNFVDKFESEFEFFIFYIYYNAFFFALNEFDERVVINVK